MKPMPHGGLRQYGGKPIWGVWVEKHHRHIIVFQGHTKKVHRLVCEAFNGPPPSPGLDCEHIDENPRNNRPENLRWATRKENLNRPKLKEYHRKVCLQKMNGVRGDSVLIKNVMA
jgi:hypothetical protein